MVLRKLLHEYRSINIYFKTSYESNTRLIENNVLLHQLSIVLKHVFFEGRLKADGTSVVELASNHFLHSYLAVRSTRSGKSIKDPFALIRFQILNSS